ncbi:methionine aminotransferase [Anaerolineales bacterium HSG25]|nr:methionine aminotransferase [Anaerolineales bacterium HSG25]
MTIQLTSKLPHVGTTIFSTMTKLSNDLGAINLSQGFPNFDPPDALRALVTYHLNNGKNQYAPMAGVPKLRAQIAAKVADLYGRNISVDDEITVTNGATEGLFVAINTVINLGDEVIIFDPAFDSYQPVIELNGGRTIHIPLDAPNFAIDWQRVRDSISPKTRLILLNFPHNPTGTILTPADLETLVEIVRDTNIFLLSDEVYEHIIFDGIAHQSLLCHAELAERTFVVSSFGKTYHATGWKIGYCIAPSHLTAEFRKIHQFLVYSIFSPAQHALADFLEQSPETHKNLAQFYQQKRDRFCNLLTDSRFKFTPTQSTFFQLLDYSTLTDLTDIEYARQLIQDIGVASIPISAFYKEKPPQHYLRFCFAKDDATLAEAASRLCGI